MSRLSDQLTTMPKETQLTVCLGRALQAGEVRVRISLLQMEKAEVVNLFLDIPLCHSVIPGPQFCKPLMDSIVTVA